MSIQRSTAYGRLFFGKFVVYSIACVAVAVCVLNSSVAGQPPADQQALTEQQRKQLLAERDRLWEAAQKFDEQDDPDKAIQAAQRMLEIERRLFGVVHEKVLVSINWLAERHERREDFARAEPLRKEALSLARAVFKEQPWKVADARVALDHVRRLAALDPDQRKQLREAEQLNSQALTFYRRGQYAQASRLAEQALRLQQSVLGNDAFYTATTLNNLAAFYKSMGDYAKAEPLYEQALAVRRKVLGETHSKTAGVLNNLAALYQSTGNYAKAEPLHKQALQISKKVLGEEHPSTAQTLNDLAGVYYSIGDYAKAEPLLEQALAIRRKVLGEERPSTANSLNSLAKLYSRTGNYAKAEPLYKQALQIARKVLGEEHPDTATFLNNLGELYQSTGNYAKAEPLHKQALQIMRKVLGEEHPDTAISLSYLGELYYRIGNYAKAEPLHKQALQIKKKVLGEEHPSTAISLDNLAFLYMSMGDYAKAEPLYKQALQIKKKALGEEHPSTGRSVNNLAGLYYLMGDYTKAELLLEQALQIHEKVLGEEHPSTATILMSLAGLYRSMGDYAKAEPLLEQTLAVHRKVLGEEHPSTAASLNNLAGLYHSMGNYAKAEPLFQQALQIERKVLGEEHPNTAGELHNLAALYQSTGEYSKAQPLFRQALEIMRKHLELTAVAQSQRQQLAMTSDVRFYFDNYLSFVITLGRDHQSAYQHLLAWKGTVLLRQRAIRAAVDQPQLKDDFAEFQRVTQQLAQSAFQTPTPQQREIWQTQLAKLSAEKEKLEARLARNSREFRQAIEPVTLNELSDVIPDDCVLVDFLEYSHHTPSEVKGGKTKWEQRFAAFVVSKDAPVRLIDLGAADLISDAIDAWRHEFGNSTESAQAGKLLRERIWEPLELDDAIAVLVSPDGALGKLPFAALPGKEKDTYLIEEQIVAVMPAAPLLPELLADQARDIDDELLLLGGVDYNRRPAASSQSDKPPREALALNRSAPQDDDQAFSYLPGTLDELNAIEAVYQAAQHDGSVTTLTETGATEAAVRQNAERHRYLHLATHGFFAAEQFRSALDRSVNVNHQPGRLLSRQSVSGFHPGLLSGLVLAGANQPDPDSDDGILTAEEVGALDLRGVDLAVLSACETGLGKRAGGGGLLGLQRSFGVAGARTVVASLWKVPDAHSQILMTEFYKNLWHKKMGKLQALRQAQLTILNRNIDLPKLGTDGRAPSGENIPASENSVTGRASPRLWAAWVLSGDPGDLSAIEPVQPSVARSEDTSDSRDDGATTAKKTSPSESSPFMLYLAASVAVGVLIMGIICIAIRNKRKSSCSSNAFTKSENDNN